MNSSKNLEDKESVKLYKILAKLNILFIAMNVDNLHNLAGSKEVIEIFGNYLKDNIVIYAKTNNIHPAIYKIICP